MSDRSPAFASITDALPDPVWTARPDGAFAYVNQRWSSLTGLRLDQTLGWAWLLALHPDDAETMRTLWVASSGGTVTLDARLRLVDGTYRWYRFRATPSHDAQGNVVQWYGSASDIDDLRRAEATIRAERDQMLAEAQRAHAEAEAEHQRLHDLFMQAPALIAILRGREGVCELFNPRFVQLWGARPVLGRPMREAWPELEGQGYFEFVEQVYDTGQPVFGSEYPGLIDRHNDGTLDEVFFNFVYAPYRNAQGQVEGILIHGVDVTDQVRARRTVEESEQRLNLALAAAEVGAWDLDLVHDTSVRSLRHDQIFGYTELQPRWGAAEFFARVVPDDQFYARQRFELAKETGQLSLQCRIPWPDESLHWIDVRGQVLRDPQGQPVRMLGVVTDITERKQIEQQKDAFLSMVSHELKTPLTSLQGFTELMQRTAARRQDPTYERYLLKIDEQIVRLNNLVTDLLDVTRLQQSKLQYRFGPFSLVQCVVEMVDNFREISHRHQLVVEGTITSAVYGDPQRIGQVLSNLLSNAIKYSPAAELIVVTLSEDAQQAVVAVQDFGIGIEAEHHTLIFERFYRVSDEQQQSFPGLGIGLYLSAEIVRQHGGRMWVESVKGHGSCFRFSIPFANGGAEHHGAQP